MDAGRARNGSPRRTTGKRGNGEGSIYFFEPRQLWCGAITADNGKRQVMYGRTRQEVAQKLHDALQKKEQGLPLNASHMTLGDWLDHWLDHVVRTQCEPSTLEGYRICVRVHIKPYMGNVRLTKLTTERVERWLRDLERDGRGVRTRQYAIQRLRTALTEAVARGHLVRNVATLARAPKQQPTRYPPPQPQDLARLLAAVRGERCEPLVVVALGTGLRRQELLGLTWERINLDGEAPTLTVDKRVNRIGGHLLARDGAKTLAGNRVVPLSPLVVQALRRQRTQQLEDRLLAGERWRGPDYEGARPTGFVFLTRHGTLLEPRNVLTLFKRVRERAGLPAHTLHGLRHDFGSLMMQMGVPDKVIAELMGHSNPAITRRVYQHASDALQHEAVSRMGRFLAAAAV
jgi:integrase